MTMESQRAARRAAMPLTAALLDEYAEFSPKVVYARENGIKAGKRPVYSEVFAIPSGYCPSYQAPVKERKQC